MDSPDYKLFNGKKSYPKTHSITVLDGVKVLVEYLLNCLRKLDETFRFRSLEDVLVVYQKSAKSMQGFGSYRFFTTFHYNGEFCYVL